MRRATQCIKPPFFAPTVVWPTQQYTEQMRRVNLRINEQGVTVFTPFTLADLVEALCQTSKS
jgi:hypothetical protein